MVDFSHLSQEVTKASAVYTFYELKGEPWVRVVPATEDNKAYFNALMSRQLRNRQRRRHLRADDLKQNRNEDAVLYAKHVVIEWGNLVDAEGEPVTLTEEHCKQFLKAIPKTSFDGLRDFAADETSFYELPDTEEVSKN